MKQLLIFTALLSFCSCGLKSDKQIENNQTAVSEKYVSIVTPQTSFEVNLTLNADKSFEMTTIHMDSGTGKQTNQETLSGTWLKDSADMILTTNEGDNIMFTSSAITLELVHDKIFKGQGYKFKPSNKAISESGYILLEAEEFHKYSRNILH